MADFPALLQAREFKNYGVDLTVSKGTAVASSSSANTLGSFVEIVASTAFDCDGLMVVLQADGTTTQVTYMLNLYVGGAGSEHLLVEGLVMQRSPHGVSHWFFPISLPAGARISAKLQASTGGRTGFVMVWLAKGGFLAPGSLGNVEMAGANFSTTRGQQIDPGGTANTKGAWAVLKNPTIYECRALLLALESQNNTAMASGEFLLDIGFGPANEEIVVLENLQFQSSSQADVLLPSALGPFPVYIPAGVRLVARAQSTIIDSVDRLFGLVAELVS
jgi:hypothetical protein